MTVDFIGILKSSLAFTNDKGYKLLLFIPINGSGYNAIVPWEFIESHSTSQADWYGAGDNDVISCTYSYNNTNKSLRMSVSNYDTAPSTYVYGIK